jgi:hypothetical protein
MSGKTILRAILVGVLVAVLLTATGLLREQQAMVVGLCAGALTLL